MEDEACRADRIWAIKMITDLLMMDDNVLALQKQKFQWVLLVKDIS